jgi:hypothetical protein
VANGGGDAMAALKEGSEQQGDLADITSSDSSVCTGCPTCSFQMHNCILLYFFCLYSKIEIKVMNL